MAVTFDDIFPEYFTLYRGQATNIPGASDPEYQIALQLANNAVRKWDRADGIEWNELWVNFADIDGSAVSTGTSEYDIGGMRKQPKSIRFIGTTSSTERPVVPAEQADMYSEGSVAYFTGGASTGFVLHLTGDLTTLNGMVIDFTYLKTPYPIVNGSSKIEMSDPNFLIHDMLAARFTNARNGFAVKVHKGEAIAALQNMKIDNNTGTYGNSDRLTPSGSGFGVSNFYNDIRL